MSYLPNIQAVLILYNEIFINLKMNIPELKLLVIGRDPTDEIIMLGSCDTNVTVTGYVDNVWDYIQKARTLPCCTPWTFSPAFAP